MNQTTEQSLEDAVSRYGIQQVIEFLAEITGEKIRIVEEGEEEE